MTASVRVPIALVVLTLVGCGSGSAAPSAPSSSGTAAGPPIQRLVAYSTCMRRHGISTFPDPDSHGNLVVTPAEHIDPASPQYERAEQACRRYGPGGASAAGMTPSQHAHALAAMTRYVKCMRKHGIPIADPFSGANGGVGIRLPPSVDPSSASYRDADAACRRLLPGANG